jgi:hypothetical protein
MAQVFSAAVSDRQVGGRIVWRGEWQGSQYEDKVAEHDVAAGRESPAPQD